MIEVVSPRCSRVTSFAPGGIVRRRGGGWHGQHHKPDTGTLRSLEWLTREIGEATPLSEINGSLVGRLVAKRRADGVGPATVNRTMTEALRRVLNRAKLWGETLPVIEWRKFMLAEPKERVRELRSDEEAALFAALRLDYHPIVRFALLTGCRIAECVWLTWADVDWGGRVIWINGKGDKRASVPMPPSVRELLWPLQGHHPSAVFTYVVRHPALGRGERRPIAYEGLVTEIATARSRAGIRDFSFHDLRHTAATRVLRATGNLNTVKRMLRHENIKTTVKYAHSQHDEGRGCRGSRSPKCRGSLLPLCANARRVPVLAARPPPRWLAGLFVKRVQDRRPRRAERQIRVGAQPG
jgi:integrase